MLMFLRCISELELKDIETGPRGPKAPDEAARQPFGSEKMWIYPVLSR